MNAFLTKISTRKSLGERRVSREKKSGNPDLCPECYDVIVNITTTRVEKSAPLPLYTYNHTRRELLSSKCKLCRFAGSLKPEGCEDRGGRMRTFSTYSLNPDFADYEDHMSSALLVLQSKKSQKHFSGNGTFGILHPEFKDHDIKPRIVQPQVVEFMVLREWLEFCKEYHTKTCQPLQGWMVPGFKVLDCMTKQVVEPSEGCEYVCLSYVWGKVAESDDSDAKFPPTIEDAILVTLYMGFQYLWIDKYCIDQKNEVEKLHQVQNMDKIYSMASLTIVAAAGSGPDYGLPGVGYRARQPQQRLVLDDLELIQVYSDTDDVRKALWATRAWTLQEGYLAKRRLIFTDREVLYLCDRMYCQESVNNKLHHRRIRTWDGLDGSHLFGVIPNSHRDHFNADRILTEYTDRNMSYDSDALNACVGILKAAGIVHWCGVPIERDINKEKFTLNLQWRSKGQGHQREKFPSWSWTAVSGGKTFPVHKSTSVEHCAIYLPTNTNQWISVDEWVKHGSDVRMLTLTTLMCIAGYTGIPRIVSARSIDEINAGDRFTNLLPKPHQHQNLWAIFPIPQRRGNTSADNAETPTSPISPASPQERDQAIISFRLLLDVDVENPGEFFSDTIALLLQTPVIGPPRTYTVLILLKPIGQYYKRVGITNWDFPGTMSRRVGNRYKVVEEPIELINHMEKQTVYLT